MGAPQDRRLAAYDIGAIPTTLHRVPQPPAAATPSVRVNYHDLNLATEQGTQALYGRIVSAARKVCAPSDIRVLVEVAAAHACEAQAVAHAVRAVNNPRLAATYSAHQRQG